MGDGVYRPAFTPIPGFNPNKRIKYWYSRAGSDNKVFFNIKRTSTNQRPMATNFEMSYLPEAICHGVYYYTLNRYDPYELHWALQNCLEMIEGSSGFQPERYEEFVQMKNAPIPSTANDNDQRSGSPADQVG